MDTPSSAWRRSHRSSDRGEREVSSGRPINRAIRRGCHLRTRSCCSASSWGVSARPPLPRPCGRLDVRQSIVSQCSEMSINSAPESCRVHLVIPKLPRGDLRAFVRRSKDGRCCGSRLRGRDSMLRRPLSAIVGHCRSAARFACQWTLRVMLVAEHRGLSAGQHMLAAGHQKNVRDTPRVPDNSGQRSTSAQGSGGEPAVMRRPAGASEEWSVALPYMRR